LNLDKIPIEFDKEPCLPWLSMTKGHNLPFFKSNHHATKPLKLIFLDEWGPGYVISSYNSRYYVCFLDVCIRFI